MITLLEVFRKLKSNPRLFFLSFLFDVLFLGSVMGIGKLFTILIPQDPVLLEAKFGVGISGFVTILFLSIFYLLLLIFLYSIFKYLILDVLQNYTHKIDFPFTYLMKFYYVNLVAILIPSMIFVVLSVFFKLSLKTDYSTIVLFVIFLVFIVFFYYFLQSSHMDFISAKSTKKSLLYGLVFAFKKFKSYYKSLLIFVIAIILYYLLTYIFSSITVNSSSIGFYSILSSILNIVTIIIVYLIIVFNRIYLYFIVNKEKNVLQ